MLLHRHGTTIGPPLSIEASAENVDSPVTTFPSTLACACNAPVAVHVVEPVLFTSTQCAERKFPESSQRQATPVCLPRGVFNVSPEVQKIDGPVSSWQSLLSRREHSHSLGTMQMSLIFCPLRPTCVWAVATLRTEQTSATVVESALPLRATRVFLHLESTSRSDEGHDQGLPLRLHDRRLLLTTTWYLTASLQSGVTHDFLGTRACSGAAEAQNSREHVARVSFASSRVHDSGTRPRAKSTALLVDASQGNIYLFL